MASVIEELRRNNQRRRALRRRFIRRTPGSAGSVLTATGWRFNITASSTACSITEMEFWNGPTKLSTVGATIVSSAPAGSGGSGTHAVVFDGDVSAGNFWFSGNVSTGWVGVIFPSAVSVDKIGIVGRHGGGQWPTAGQIQYSLDGGSNWITKWNVSNLVASTAEKRWMTDPAVGYKHHRIRFASMPSGAVRLGDAEFRSVIGGANVSGLAFRSRVSADVILGTAETTNVFDNNPATHWAATTAAQIECFFEKNAMPTIAQIMLRAPSFSQDQAPVELRYDTSVDATNWTLNVFSQTGLAAWAANESRTFNV